MCPERCSSSLRPDPAFGVLVRRHIARGVHDHEQLGAGSSESRGGGAAPLPARRSSGRGSSSRREKAARALEMLLLHEHARVAEPLGVVPDAEA